MTEEASNAGFTRVSEENLYTGYIISFEALPGFDSQAFPSKHINDR